MDAGILAGGQEARSVAEKAGTTAQGLTMRSSAAKAKPN
jgi:hypothetical protein